MPTVLSIVLSLVGLFLIHLLLGLRRVARNVGKLSGPFFFFSPVSIPGHLLSRVVREIPYLHPGDSWVLRKKYEGTGV